MPVRELLTEYTNLLSDMRDVRSRLAQLERLTAGIPSDFVDATASGSAAYCLPLAAYGGNTGNAVVASANQVRVLRLVMPITLTVTSIHFECVTAAAGSSSSVGIYNNDGTSLLIDSGAISTATTGIKSATLAAAKTLTRNIMYYVAFTTTSLSVVLRGRDLVVSNVIASLVNGDGSLHLGTAANSATAGVLPSSLGTITAVAVNMAEFKLQG